MIRLRQSCIWEPCLVTITIECIIYDVGHTLLLPAPSTDEIRAHAEALGGFSVDAEAFRAALPNAGLFLKQFDEPFASLWASPERLEHAWQTYYATALRDAGVTRPWGELLAVGGKIDDWYMHRDRWAIFPDVHPALDEGQRRGYRQGIISDWGPDLIALLHDLELAQHFDFIVASALTGYAKPSREIFASAVARAGAPAERCLYVGDSYIQDMIGARANGLHPVLIDRAGAAPRVDVPVVRTLPEIFAVIDTGF